jgi:hypothetical protein
MGEPAPTDAGGASLAAGSPSADPGGRQAGRLTRESLAALQPLTSRASSRAGVIVLGALLVVVVVLVALLIPGGGKQHAAQIGTALPGPGLTSAGLPLATGSAVGGGALTSPTAGSKGPSAAGATGPRASAAGLPVSGSARPSAATGPGSQAVAPAAGRAPAAGPPPAAASSCGGISPPSGFGLHSTLFCDTFSGGLNPSTWNTFIATKAGGGAVWNGDGQGGSAQGCAFDADYFLPSQVSVGGNGLYLTATRQNHTGPCGSGTNNYTWVSGVVSTYNHFEFSGGYVQFVMKAPPGNGFWPGLWMAPGAGAGSTIDEIDADEGGFDPLPASQTFSYRLHYGASQFGTSIATGVDLTSGFHTYGVYWVPGQSVTWYLDGSQVARATSADFTIPSQQESLLMNLSVCSSACAGWHPPYDASTPNNSVMEVRSVAVWQ